MNRKILIIDDSHEDFELAERAILKFDASVICQWIDNGTEALKLVDNINQEKTEQVDLILLDIKMHEIDGFDILKKLKSNGVCKQIPVVMLSSSKMEKDIIKAYSEGANSYIQKPLGYIDYSKILNKICDYWLNTNTSSYVS